MKGRRRERGEREGERRGGREERGEERHLRLLAVNSKDPEGLHKSDSAVKSNYGLCDLVPIVSRGQLEQGEEGGLDIVETIADNFPRILLGSSDKGLAARETCADPWDSSLASSCGDM